MDIVGQYQLVANGQAFYTQSFAIEESYITSLATTEPFKAVDPYSKTRHKDFSGLSSNRCMIKGLVSLKNESAISFF